MPGETEHEFFAAKEQARKSIQHALSGFSASAAGLLVEVTSPREKERGLFACPIAFSLARRVGKPPQEVAQEVAKGAQVFIDSIGADKRLFESAKAEAGYVNFTASPLFYSNGVCHAARLGERFGLTSTMKGKTVVVEFSQPNVGKPFHIGHIRSTILGDSASRLLSSQGARAVRFNYLGDSGTQVAKLVLALEEFKDLPKATDEKGLLEYYTKIHKEIESNPELSEKARAILSLIESADPGIMEVVSRIRTLSMEAFDRNYALLDVKFDETLGESNFISGAVEAVDECISRGIAKREKDGSVVADLEPHGLPNTILLRSNGTTLYLTRDFALADYKYAKYSFDKGVIFTASEQNMHFRQLQKILTLLGRPYAANYGHVGFGLVFLQSGKLSTREGRVVFLEDVLNEAIASAKAELLAREHQYPQGEVDAIAKVVGVGSLKFAFLRISSEKNITYDPQKASSFEGDTGAYVQYTCVRARNILRKLNPNGNHLSDALSSIPPEFQWGQAERKLAQTIAAFPDAVESSAQSYSPHILCDYLLKLSADFSSFYETSKVIDPEHPVEQAGRAVLVQGAANALENGLGLLGISVPQRM